MARKWQRQKDDLGSVLASSIVVIGGSGFCLMVAIFGSEKASPWLIAGIVAVPVLFLLATVRFRRSSARTRSGLGFWSSLFRSPPDDGLASQYRPRRVGEGRPQPPAGTNKPISAGEAREIRITSASTWVPTRDSNGRSRKK
ncbi:MAG: hypothetical protein R3C19_10750 [Planctomycetaceae bacterium]